VQADFLDAHQRHFDDAERLFRSGRLANADQLYGIASECGLKRLMVAFGMAVDADGAPTDFKKDRKHVDAIWARYETYRSRHQPGTGYLLPTSDPFGDWDVSQRYAHQGNFDVARVLPHKAAAQIVCELIKKAQLEGLI
jgi:hypothetical protein